MRSMGVTRVLDAAAVRKGTSPSELVLPSWVPDWTVPRKQRLSSKAYTGQNQTEEKAPWPRDANLDHATTSAFLERGGIFTDIEGLREGYRAAGIGKVMIFFQVWLLEAVTLPTIRRVYTHGRRPLERWEIISPVGWPFLI